MVNGIQQIAPLDNPTHQVIEERVLKNNLHPTKIPVPFGVIRIIFEARPNVVTDCSALCLKSGNSCILKCGKEAKSSHPSVCNAMETLLVHKDIANELLITLYPKLQHPGVIIHGDEETKKSS